MGIFITKRVERSKTGLPTITENGGGATNTGGAVIVCGRRGERLKPLFVPRGYSNGSHAIFVARIGMHILVSDHDRAGENITACRITAIGTQDNPDDIVTEVVGEYQNGDGNIPSFLSKAADAAREKGHCYHCREPHFIDDGSQQPDEAYMRTLNGTRPLRYIL